MWLSPNFSKLQSLGIENGENTPMVVENSLRSHQQSSLDQQMGGFVWYSLFASQTSFFVRSGGLLPECLVGTATGILDLGMHCTFYLLSEH